MRQTFSVITIGILCLAAQAGAGTLVNPGFETGTLAPWITAGAATVTNAQAHSGIYSVSAGGGDDITQTFVAVPTADITELSFWVTDLGGVILDSYTLSYSDSSSNSNLALDFSPTGGWEKFDITSQLQPGKSLTGFQIFGTSPGSAYFDDFVLNTTTATPEPSTFLLFASAAGLFLLRTPRKLRR